MVVIWSFLTGNLGSTRTPDGIRVLHWTVYFVPSARLALSTALGLGVFVLPVPSGDRWTVALDLAVKAKQTEVVAALGKKSQELAEKEKSKARTGQRLGKNSGILCCHLELLWRSPRWSLKLKLN